MPDFRARSRCRKAHAHHNAFPDTHPGHPLPETPVSFSDTPGTGFQSGTTPAGQARDCLLRSKKKTPLFSLFPMKIDFPPLFKKGELYFHWWGSSPVVIHAYLRDNQSLISGPSTFKNFASQSGWAGHARIKGTDLFILFSWPSLPSELHPPFDFLLNEII